jgi:hypothetical protein
VGVSKFEEPKSEVLCTDSSALGATHRHTHTFPWGGWPWGYIKFIFHFKKYFTKIVPKSPRWHQVRLQGKLKLIEKENNLHICKFYLYFSIFQCTSHRLIPVANMGWSVDHIKPLIRLCLQHLCFLNFAIAGGEGGGCSLAARQPPLGVSMVPWHLTTHNEQLVNRR